MLSEGLNEIEQSVPSSLGRLSMTITENCLPALCASHNTFRMRDELEQKYSKSD